MSAQHASHSTSAIWPVPGWVPTVAWLVVAAAFAVQAAYSPHASLAGSWCGEGELLAAASILGHCPACYGFALALFMAVASFWYATGAGGGRQRRMGP